VFAPLRDSSPSTETGYGVTVDHLDDFMQTLICNLTVPGDRPGHEAMTAMSEYMETLFDCAATACRQNKAGTSQEHMRRLVNADTAILHESFELGLLLDRKRLYGEVFEGCQTRRSCGFAVWWRVAIYPA